MVMQSITNGHVLSELVLPNFILVANRNSTGKHAWLEITMLPYNTFFPCILIRLHWIGMESTFWKTPSRKIMLLLLHYTW
jgi:hypothetical protein